MSLNCAVALVGCLIAAAALSENKGRKPVANFKCLVVKFPVTSQQPNTSLGCLTTGISVGFFVVVIHAIPSFVSHFVRVILTLFQCICAGFIRVLSSTLSFLLDFQVIVNTLILSRQPFYPSSFPLSFLCSVVVYTVFLPYNTI